MSKVAPVMAKGELTSLRGSVIPPLGSQHIRYRVYQYLSLDLEISSTKIDDILSILQQIAPNSFGFLWKQREYFLDMVLN